MRDIIKDAAILAMAKAAEPHMFAETFLGSYAGDSEEAREYYTELLDDYGIIEYRRKPTSWYDPDPAWMKEPEYIWVWTSAK